MKNSDDAVTVGNGRMLLEEPQTMANHGKRSGKQGKN